MIRVILYQVRTKPSSLVPKSKYELDIGFFN